MPATGHGQTHAAIAARVGIHRAVCLFVVVAHKNRVFLPLANIDYVQLSIRRRFGIPIEIIDEAWNATLKKTNLVICMDSKKESSFKTIKSVINNTSNRSYHRWLEFKSTISKASQLFSVPLQTPTQTLGYSTSGVINISNTGTGEGRRDSKCCKIR